MLTWRTPPAFSRKKNVFRPIHENQNCLEFFFPSIFITRLTIMSALLKLSSIYQNWSKSFPLFTRRVDLLKNSAVKKLNKSRFSTKQAWEIDTNVQKDVILYTHNNERFHKYMNIFAITQLGFWLYLAEFSMSTLRDVPVAKKESDSDLPWYRSINLGENKYRRGITTLCIAVGM